MTYYGDYYSSTLAGLVSNGNGDCDAWAQFFQACLNVHKIGASYIQICPDQSAFNIQIKYLKVLYNMPGQNNPNPPRVFNYHAVSIYSNCIYDSSYGNIENIDGSFLAKLDYIFMERHVFLTYQLKSNKWVLIDKKSEQRKKIIK